MRRAEQGGREVLVPDVGINPFVHTPDGWAAIDHDGRLLLSGAAGHLRVLPPVGPATCLAADPSSGRLAVGGDRLVLLDATGRELASAPCRPTCTTSPSSARTG